MLQDTMSYVRFRTNRKIELHEDLRLDDKIDELQDYIRHRYRQ